MYLIFTDKYQLKESSHAYKRNLWSR